ncbi:MAG TPA: hypothetical protein VK173_01520 [Lacibacter sp.]|nr:hypothetical protein [Lacibacter sp.]
MSSNLRQSERFVESIMPYFLTNGYTYKKASKKFAKTNNRGFQQVGLWFKISSFGQVSINWGFQIEKLEKIYYEISGEKSKYKSSLTLMTDLPNYTRFENNVEHTFPLYDPSNYEYSDLSINNAVAEIINAFEKYTVPFFSKYDDYFELEKFFNNQEYKQVRGLILAKYCKNDDIDKISSIYCQQIKARNLGEDCDEMKLYHKTIAYLNQYDINILLD